MPAKSKHENKYKGLAKSPSQTQKYARIERGGKIQLARSLAATPDERWQIHETFLRSHGLFSHWERKVYGFKW
ncbi:MAG: hypothetical protein HY298_23280 [Verrucomicrobia bacterium]|nr:hypothetical protein [Verrucomicrobiota bacterium]